MPEGVKVANVDYADQSSLIDALRGQDALIITMKAGEREAPGKLHEAAATAGVPWIVPNEWGSDPTDAALARDSFLGIVRDANRAQIESLGVSAWLGIACGFWYEFSLAGSEVRYGFDFPSRSVTFYDDGATKINTSTLPQVGRAVASLLALKVLPQDENDTSPTLSRFRNKTAYVSSFCVSQRDMLDSVLRVTGDKAEDWTITHQGSVERYQDGLARFQKGDMRGFGQALYARLFYQDGCGNFEAKHGLDNDVLGLPKEDLDEFTKLAVDKALDPNRIPY